MAPALAFASTSAAGAAASSSLAAAWSLDLGDDPTDWDLEGFKHLRELDASLRCELCFGIFVAPVSVKECNHTFCSSCVREVINSGDSTSGGQQCPKCRRKGVFDSQLVPNTAMEGASTAWKLARPQLAELQRAERERRESAGATTSPLGTRETSAKRKSSGDSSAANGAQDVEDEGGSSGRVLRSRGKRQKTDGESATSPYVVPDSDEDEDGDGTWVEGAEVGAGSRRGKGAATPQPASASASPAKKSPGKNGDYRNIAADEMVQCPICSHSFTNVALQRHLDKGGCSAGDPPPSDKERGIVAASLSSSGAGMKGSSWFSRAGSSAAAGSAPPAKLKRPHYELLKDREIVKLLADARLKTTGIRERLVSRHRHWVNLCNANMDASEKNRKSEKVLRKDMEQWERGADDADKTKKMGGMDKKLKGWEEKNQGQFKELISIARSGHRRNVETHRGKEVGDGAATSASTSNGETVGSAAPASSLSSSGTMGPPSQVPTSATAQSAISPPTSSASQSGPAPASITQTDDGDDGVLLDSDALDQELSQA